MDALDVPVQCIVSRDCYDAGGRVVKAGGEAALLRNDEGLLPEWAAPIDEKDAAADRERRTEVEKMTPAARAEGLARARAEKREKERAAVAKKKAAADAVTRKAEAAADAAEKKADADERKADAADARAEAADKRR